MKPRFAATLALFMSLASVELAQALPNEWPPPRGQGERVTQGSGAFLVGMAHVDQFTLNRRLRKNGYPKLSPALNVLGGEGRVIFPSGLVLGARGIALLNQTGPGPGSLHTHFGGGLGMLNLGYALLRTEAFVLTLTGDVGVYGLNLEISDDEAVAFDELLAAPRRSSSLDAVGLLTGLTLALDAQVPLMAGGGRSFLGIGIRLSGLYGPALGHWGRSDGSPVVGEPSLGLTGGYAALAFGFGNRSTARPTPRP
jgi:hypothetical protein